MEEPLLASWMTVYPAAIPLDWPWIVVIVAAVLAVGVVVLRPDLIARTVVWLFTHAIYRIRVTGLEHVPATGAALLVCNHVSYIDWLLIRASLRRPIRFLVWAPYAKTFVIRHILQWTRSIPIDGSAGPRAIVQALRQASEALAAGDLVCIFAEGGVTRTGFMLPFHRGFEQIVKRTPAPIIPVCLDHVWGSVFSWRGGRILWKWPQELPYPVQVGLGEKMPPTASAAEVRLAIQKLSADAAIARTATRRPVHVQFVRTAAKRPFARCISDSASKVELNYGKTLAGAMMLARRLRPMLGDEPMVGLWLPPSVGDVIANIAISLLRKTSVNLNYTAGPEVVRSSIRQCNIKHVLSSRIFVSKGIKLPEAEDAGYQIIYLEDFRKDIGTSERLLSILKVFVLPGWFLERWLLRLDDHKIDDLATIIFSSGSTGEPKGVMLTHQNIMANAESMIQAVDVDHHDVILGILPFFHSFGYTVTLWVPLLVGASTVYHHDPRQAKEIGELARSNGGTILLATPTFLRFFHRRCEPGDFKTMRILICGAEKLPQPLAKEFQEKFGVLPLEGYGCTELSPVASANVPDKELGNTRQIGNKPGTIGQPLPGNAARIVNPETFEPVPLGQEGLLLIYGANVMKGYLNRPELTQQVIRDGWYVTGDIARIDEDGFITITGRLSRFAKVGGEMVPLEKIENELHDILGTSERVCAVASVPDEKRGERLVVLHLDQNHLDTGKLVEQLAGKGLPNLWVPGERDFFEVSELPVLGSGKLDLQRLKQMALELAKN